MTDNLPDLPPEIPAFSVPWLASLKNALMRVGSEWVLPSSHLPTQGQIAAIRNRSSALTSRLSCGAGNDKALAVELAKLLTAFPARGQDEISTELRMEAYFEALTGIPAWAVSEARTDVIRGVAGLDPRFAPTPPQLADLARAKLALIGDELTMLRRIETARIESCEPTPEEHEIVSKGFADLLAWLGKKDDEHLRVEAMEGLRATCRELGIPESSIEELPEAPERTGTFRRPRVAV